MKNRYRTVWISDLHLCSVSCKSDELNQFLEETKTDTLFLVGDIIDGWAIKRRFSSIPQSHLNVIRSFLSKARKGTQVYYVIGNHDEFIRKFDDFFDFKVGNITVGNEFVYETLTHGKLWVTHGDLYDCITRMHRWLSVLGDIGYVMLVRINHWFNKVRTKIGYPYWSISNYTKQKVKKAVEFINNFEDVISLQCQKQQLAGVVCGHIHTPAIKQINDITYYNTGDWVENCTALVEHHDGRIELIYYKSSSG